MLSKRYIEDKPTERRWISGLDRWLKKVNGYSMLSTGPLTPPTRQRRVRLPSDNNGTVDSSSYRRSSARPVVVVERFRHPHPEEQQHDPVINLNDQFIEVYYFSKTSKNHFGQFERYTRVSDNKMCYCCDKCVACKRDRNANIKSTSYGRHRQLNQSNSNRNFTRDVSSNVRNKNPSQLRSHHSFST